MAKKPLGKDSMGVQKTMRLGDGPGQLPLNVMANLAGQLTYFEKNGSRHPPLCSLIRIW